MRDNQPVTLTEYVIGEQQYLISRTDLKGRITYANPAFVEVSGFSRAELIGAPHNLVRHPDMPSEAFADLWATCRAGEAWSGLVKNRRKNGDFYWVLATVTPTLENGSVVGYTSVRVKPPSEWVRQAEAVYTRFRRGAAGNLRIRRGQVQAKGIRGVLRKIRLDTLRARLTGIILLSALLLAGAGALGLWGVASSNDKLLSVYQDGMVPISQLSALAQKVDKNMLLVAEALATPNLDVMKRSGDEIVSNIEDMNRQWNAYIASVDAGTRLQAERFESIRKRFVTEGLLKTVEMLRAGSVEGAQQQYAEAVKPLYRPMRDELDALMKLEIKSADQDYQHAQSKQRWVRWTMFAGVFGGIVMLFVLGGILRRAIQEPLLLAVSRTRQIAAGDLTGKVDGNTRDELGQLIFGLGVMKNSLLSIVADVREGIECINVASREIAAGNTNLSARTEQQAASLEQTASSMEQLTATVKQNADNARQASTLAVNASEIAARGGKVVGDVVDTMQGISASSNKIVDIISVIEGIAFQTNILALNAAVEAARAGEQGRGFAVVAGEVRTLAQRSASAAKEIKGLIEDSVGRVESGSTLVSQAGKTMDEIVQAVRHVTDIMGEISAASAEQSSGIEQVNRAVTQMDEVTQQNAALVEEAAAAAGALEEQAQHLRDAMSVFHVDQVVGSSTRKEASTSAVGAQSPRVAMASAASAARSRRTDGAVGSPVRQRSAVPLTATGQEEAQVLQLIARRGKTAPPAGDAGDWEAF